MEPIKIAGEIREAIDRIRLGRTDLQRRAENKAKTLAEYEKTVSIVLIKLRNGVSYVLDGEKIKDPPVSIAEKVAKGICWKEKLAAEQAEAEYRNAVIGMQALLAELNGLQSIFRHLDNV